MKEFFSYLEREFTRQSTLINAVFDANAKHIFQSFAERVYEDVIADYVHVLLEESLKKTIDLYFEAAVESYHVLRKLTQSLPKIEPVPVIEQAANQIFYNIFAPVAIECVESAINDVRDRCNKQIENWKRHVCLQDFNDFAVSRDKAAAGRSDVS